LHEVSGPVGYHLAVLLQREVLGIQQMELQVPEIALVGMRAFCRDTQLINEGLDECS
jgi:hypothetical protein